MSRSTTAGGVPAGATTPDQVLASKPAAPCSTMVGTSGKASSRRAAVTPSARSDPARTSGEDEEPLSNSTWQFPAIVSARAGALPRCGMCSIRRPKARRKISPARCEGEATPMEQKLSRPGSRLAHSAKAAAPRAGEAGGTTMNSGVAEGMATWTKERRGS